MALAGRMGDKAIDLRRADRLRQEREGLRIGIATLSLKLGPIDRFAIEPWRRSGLQSAQTKAELLQSFAEAEGGASRPCARRESAGRQYGSCRAKMFPSSGRARRSLSSPVSGRDPFNPAVFEDDIGGLGFDHAKIRCGRDRGLHGFSIEPRSACARGPRTAGPLARLRTRN